MASWSSPNLFLSILLLLISINHSTSSELSEDRQALLEFINNIRHCPRIQWNTSIFVCNWYGVQCDCTNSYVEELRLGGACLIGPIPANTLSRLSHLRVLTLRNNHIQNPLPSDFSNLTSLQRIYLDDNLLYGEFPKVLTQMTNLTDLDLSSNNINSDIPADLNNLSNLKSLYLQNNNFSGDLPDLNIHNLTKFNVSINQMITGLIPKFYNKFPPESFSLTDKLFGSPKIVADLSLRKLSPAAKIAIDIASAVVFLILLLRLLFLISRRWRDRTSRTSRRKHVPAATATSSAGEV